MSGSPEQVPCSGAVEKVTHNIRDRDTRNRTLRFAMHSKNEAEKQPDSLVQRAVESLKLCPSAIFAFHKDSTGQITLQARL